MNVINGISRVNGKQSGENDLRGFGSISDRILRLIWNEHRISRIEIAKRLGLARSTVTEIVKEIIDSGFVNEVGTGKSKGGRRPIVLEFQDDTKCILGIDIGQNHVSVALTNLRGKLIHWVERSHPVRHDLEGTLNLVIELSDICLTRAKISQQLMGIGVSLPSPIDPVNPGVIPEVVLPEWGGRNKLERIAQKYNVPVYIDNDANLGAIAEHRWGAGRGVDDMIYIKSSTGIGAGYILDGQIYRGATGSAGEIGHLPIDIYGKRCVCGLRGCLVTYVGQHALEARAEQLFNDYPESTLKGKKPSIIDIEDAALSGDTLALRVVREAADYLGTAIAGWLNVMNPRMVIFGGDLARTGELLLEPIREKFRHCTIVNSVADVKITTGELGAQAVAIGAATLAIEETFAETDILKQKTHPAAL
ncbi:MAG: ROK family transcriptional regulator [Ignavibacteriaceae bacterium]|nr:ROK family transcriptional regulator [Ignavibacteriaceae bacterium]